MSRNRANAVNLPARVWHHNGQPAGKGNDTLDGIYTVPKEPFLHRYGKRIAGGLACAAVVSLVMHLTPVAEGLRWIGEGIRWSLGRPALLAKRHDPRPVGKRIEIAIKKAREIASEHKPAIPKVVAPPVAKVIPKAIAPVVKAAPLIASIPKAAPVAVNIAAPKVVKKIEQIERGIEKREEKIANAGHDIADAARKTGDKIKQAIKARKDAKEQEKYDHLLFRAKKVKLTVDESWSITRLEAEINEAEDAIWHKRFNGQCPRCHRPARIHRDLKYGPILCPGCQFIYSVGWARRLGAPPRPQPGGGWRLPF
jgi:hypothetical protein